MLDLVKKLFPPVTCDMCAAGCTDYEVKTGTDMSRGGKADLDFFCFSGSLCRLFYGKQVYALARVKIPCLARLQASISNPLM